MGAYDDLREYLFSLTIIDTHEHLPSTEDVRDRETDVLKEYLPHYFNRDLVSAGLPEADYIKITEGELSIGEKWKMVEDYWEMSRLTGYGRALDISVRELYGIDRISGDTIEELNGKFLESLKPGHFKKVLSEKCNIETSLLSVETLEEEYDPLQERSICCDRDLYTPVFIINNYIHPGDWDDIRRVERESGIRITSFNAWLEATEVSIGKAMREGSRILKNSTAYVRSLNYEVTTRREAEEAFNIIFKTKHFPDWDRQPAWPAKPFQDYMYHFILDIANRENLVMQIHTGIQEGNGNCISNSNPEYLDKLILKYPDVDFDLFHIGYPYQNVITVLAKNFPNAYIDMCWAHIVSPNASVAAIVEWIDTVPLNKISAFGGDYLFIDGVYGHQYLARENVAKALALKVREGLFDVDRAKEIGKLFFYDNPKHIFSIEEV